MRIRRVCAITLFGLTLTAGGFECVFSGGGWDAEQWILVKSPRWKHVGGWLQQDGYIENQTPEGASKKDMLGPRAAETYTSMVYRQKVSGNVDIASTMVFEDRMAPLIVLAPELGENTTGHPEYREHWEVVLFDKGINVWHHTYRDGKPAWRKAAYASFQLKPATNYRLVVRVRRSPRGPMLTMAVDGHEFGYVEDNLPESFYVGITGCEGRNRFYDFSCHTKK